MGGRAVVALALVFVLLGLAPFAAALEVHHELAAADHDGHEHSDTDLCQWVQHHTGNSVTCDAPVLVSHVVPDQLDWPVLDVLSSALFVGSHPSRAPPRF